MQSSAHVPDLVAVILSAVTKLTSVFLLHDTDKYYLPPNKRRFITHGCLGTLNAMSQVVLKTEEPSLKSHILNLKTHINKPSRKKVM